jgi:dTDP-4-dehydrorhamnose 3,5-epimerase
MRFHATPLPGAIIIEPEPVADERGLFARLFDVDAFRAHNLPTEFVQASTSYNQRRGTLRGLHYQMEPFAEAKLVRCTAGTVFDVIVDIRPASPSFRCWHAVELGAENRFSLFVPPGFAHGFETLVDGTEILYQMSRLHAPDAERGIIWNDPTLGIAWPIPPTVMSKRDLTLPRLTESGPA